MHTQTPHKDHSLTRRFAELSTVTLAHGLTIEGRLLPEGARGTIVAAYSDGIGYEVEFERPFHLVATLEADDLKA